MTFIESLFLEWGVLSTLLVALQTIIFIVSIASPLRPNGLRWIIVAGFVVIADCAARILYVLTSSYGPPSQRVLMAEDLLRCVLLAMILPGVFTVLLIIKHAISGPPNSRLPLVGFGSLAALGVGVIVVAVLLASMVAR